MFSSKPGVAVAVIAVAFFTAAVIIVIVVFAHHLGAGAVNAKERPRSNDRGLSVLPVATAPGGCLFYLPSIPTLPALLLDFSWATTERWASSPNTAAAAETTETSSVAVMSHPNRAARDTATVASAADSGGDLASAERMAVIMMSIDSMGRILWEWLSRRKRTTGV
jgi:hypothetical protein